MNYGQWFLKGLSAQVFITTKTETVMGQSNSNSLLAQMTDNVSSMVGNNYGSWHVEHHSQEHLQILVVWILEADEKRTLNMQSKS